MLAVVFDGDLLDALQVLNDDALPLQLGHRLGTDHPSVGSNAHAGNAKALAQAPDNRQQRFHVGGIAGPERGFGLSLERAVFASVLHRLTVSGSDRACERWLDTYCIDGADGLPLHRLYRAIGWLGEELADTTSLMFYERGGETLGKNGRSKERRPDLHQVIVGVVIDTEGRPI